MKLLNPRSVFSTSTIDAAGVDVISIHRSVFTIDFLSHDDNFTFKRVEAWHDLVIISESRRPGKMHRAGVLDVWSEEAKLPSLLQNLLNGFIKEELTPSSSTIFENRVAPFVVDVIVIEMRRNNLFVNRTSVANIL